MKATNLLRAILLIASLLAVLTAPAQSRRGKYRSITYEHYNPDSNIYIYSTKNTKGYISVTARKIWIDSSDVKKRQIWFIQHPGRLEHSDDGAYLRDMLVYGISRSTGGLEFTYSIILLIKPDRKTITDVCVNRPYNWVVNYSLE